MLDTLLQQLPGVWRAASLAQTRGAIPSGHAALDAALGGGWPHPALIELLYDQEGIGELQLLLPLIAAQSGSQAAGGLREHSGLARRASNLANTADVMLWLNPPHAVQAVALMQCGLDPSRHWVSEALTSRDTLWAMEQALRSGACSMAIAWAAGASMASLRRLKLAAVAGRCLGVLCRPARESAFASPATVRIELNAQGACLHLSLSKIQGRLPTAVVIDVQARLTGAMAHSAVPLSRRGRGVRGEGSGAEEREIELQESPLSVSLPGRERGRLPLTECHSSIGFDSAHSDKSTPA